MDTILYKSLHQYDHCGYDPRHYGSTVLVGDREVAHLLRCCHCSSHFPDVRIPGKERGWCTRCAGPVCPNPACDECVPFFRWLESVERNLPVGQMPISVYLGRRAAATKPRPVLGPDGKAVT